MNQIKKKITCSLAGAVRVFSSVFIERGEFKLHVVSLMSRNNSEAQSSRSTTFNDTKAQSHTVQSPPPQKPISYY
jgi:hypothetical protein